MMVHEGGERHPDRLLRRRRRRRRDRAEGRAHPDPGLLRRDAADLQLRGRLLRGAGQPGRDRVRLEALGLACRWIGWRSPGIELGREGVRLTAGAEYFHEILHPILVSTPESAALYTPEGRQLVEGDVFHYPEMSDALERFAADGRRALLPRRDCPGGLRLGPRARRDARHGRHGGLRADRAAAGQRELPRARGAHQPAAVLRGDPDRLLARPARAPRRRAAGWRRSSRRCEAANAQALRRLSRGAARPRVRAAVPRTPTSTRSPRGSRTATGSAATAARAARRSRRTDSARRPTSP